MCRATVLLVPAAAGRGGAARDARRGRALAARHARLGARALATSQACRDAVVLVRDRRPAVAAARQAGPGALARGVSRPLRCCLTLSLSLSLLLRASCGANVCVRDIVHATACAAYRYWIRSVRRVRHAQAQFVMRDVARCADSVALHAPRPPAAHKTEFMFVDDWCRVISGREEAVFGWVAAQQLFILAADDLDVRRAASSLPPSMTAHALTARHECRASWPSARRLA